jgi:hypothetical protein
MSLTLGIMVGTGDSMTDLSLPIRVCQRIEGPVRQENPAEGSQDRDSLQFGWGHPAAAQPLPGDILARISIDLERDEETRPQHLLDFFTLDDLPRSAERTGKRERIGSNGGNRSAFVAGQLFTDHSPAMSGQIDGFNGEFLLGRPRAYGFGCRRLVKAAVSAFQSAIRNRESRLSTALRAFKINNFWLRRLLWRRWGIHIDTLQC